MVLGDSLSCQQPNKWSGYLEIDSEVAGIYFTKAVMNEGEIVGATVNHRCLRLGGTLRFTNDRESNPNVDFIGDDLQTLYSNSSILASINMPTELQGNLAIK